MSRPVVVSDAGLLIALDGCVPFTKLNEDG